MAAVIDPATPPGRESLQRVLEPGFAWMGERSVVQGLIPTKPLTKPLADDRRHEMEVFLSDPGVQIAPTTSSACCARSRWVASTGRACCETGGCEAGRDHPQPARDVSPAPDWPVRWSRRSPPARRSAAGASAPKNSRRSCGSKSSPLTRCADRCATSAPKVRRRVVGSYVCRT